MSTAQKHVLVIGLRAPAADSPPEQKLAAGPTSETLLAKVESQLDEARAGGYDITVRSYFDHELLGADTAAGIETDLRALLRSRRWDGYVIGNGVRAVPSLNVAFEKLVNWGREEAPGTPMGFNRMIGDIAETIARIC